MHRSAAMEFAQSEVFGIGDDIIVTFTAERYRTSKLGATANTFVNIQGFAG